MKKFMTLLLALVMVLSLVACGAPTSGGDSGEGATGAEVEENVVPEEPSTPEATFAEVANGGLVLVDDDQCKITITGVEEGYQQWKFNRTDGGSDYYDYYIDEEPAGFTLFVSVENKRTDKVIAIACWDAAALNGLSDMRISFFDEENPEELYTGEENFIYGAKEIEPGETAAYKVNIFSYWDTYNAYLDSPEDSDNMIAPGMTAEDVSVISAGFEVLEKDENGERETAQGEKMTAKTVSFNLYRDSEETASYYERTPKDSDIVLYEDEVVTVTAVSYYAAEPQNVLILFIENRAETGIKYYVFRDQRITGENTSVEEPGYFNSCVMIPNSCAYAQLEARELDDERFVQPVYIEDVETWEFGLEYINNGAVTHTITLSGDDLQQLYGA